MSRFHDTSLECPSKARVLKALTISLMPLWCDSNFKGPCRRCHVTGVMPFEGDCGTMNLALPFPLSFVRNEGRDFTESFMYFSMMCGFTSRPKQQDRLIDQWPFKSGSWNKHLPSWVDLPQVFVMVMEKLTNTQVKGRHLCDCNI